MNDNKQNFLTPKDLMPLKVYTKKRFKMRTCLMMLKKKRDVNLGAHIRLLFENRTTILYQIQEMLRIERIFEPEGILEELKVYNPLVPDASNLKATMMIEYSNRNERRSALAKLIGIEKSISMQINGGEKIIPVSNEDLTRDNNEKTSAVHFMRFELMPEEIHAFKAEKPILVSVDQPHYQTRLILEKQTQQALSQDFDPVNKF